MEVTIQISIRSANGPRRALESMARLSRTDQSGGHRGVGGRSIRRNRQSGELSYRIRHLRGVLNASLISEVDFPGDIAVSGGHVFVTSFTLGTIGEYDAATGAAINPSIVTGLDFPNGIAVSGNDLFVVNHNGTIGEYTTSGATVNASLITFVDNPFGIAVAADTAVPGPFLARVLRARRRRHVAGRPASPQRPINVRNQSRRKGCPSPGRCYSTS